MIYSSPIAYKDFFKQERDNLAFISGLGMGDCFQDLSNKSYIFSNQMKSIKDSQIEKNNFLFDCSMDILIENKCKKIIFESNLTSNYKMHSYSIVICDNDAMGSDHRLLRKFHFDFVAQPEQTPGKPKPVYHLQYGGTETPQMKKMGINDINIFPWLSVPRFIFYPINFLILLDLMLSEFPSEETKKLTEKREWREKVKSNEEFLIKPYIQNTNDFLSRGHSSTSLLREYFYGEK